MINSEYSLDKLDMKNKIQNIIDNNIYMKFLGLEIIKISPEETIGRIPFKEELVNPYDNIHGGVLHSLADIVSGFAACSSGSFHSTVNSSINYIKPAWETEYVYCVAKIVNKGNTLSVYRVEILDDNDKLFADGSFTFYNMKKEF